MGALLQLGLYIMFGQGTKVLYQCKVLYVLLFTMLYVPEKINANLWVLPLAVQKQFKTGAFYKKKLHFTFKSFASNRTCHNLLLDNRWQWTHQSSCSVLNHMQMGWPIWFLTQLLYRISSPQSNAGIQHSNKPSGWYKVTNPNLYLKRGNYIRFILSFIHFL